MDVGAADLALRISDVSKSYGPVKALDTISFDVARGEFVALLGPNGAGKSTLFQMLSGLFVADSGRIVVDGHDMARDPVPALAGLGIVFQQPTLDLELTVAGNLHFHAGLHGLSRAEAGKRIARELANVGLSGSEHVKAATLSGGNRRKVELARALMHDVRILLMDEPTVGLDPASRADILRLVHALCNERKIAVLWATHLCEEVGGASRIVVLHNGHLLNDSTPDTFLARSGKPNIEAAFLDLTVKKPPTSR